MSNNGKFGARTPWPQAPVPGQEGKGPTVLHVPFSTELEFQRTIGTRILGSVAFGWLGPLWRALRRPYPLELDDAAVLKILFETVFSRFIVTDLDVADQNRFEAF